MKCEVMGRTFIQGLFELDSALFGFAFSNGETTKSANERKNGGQTNRRQTDRQTDRHMDGRLERRTLTNDKS